MTISYAQRKAKKTSPQENMLRDFLLAKTPYEKRKVIETFNPHYFALTPDPKEKHDETRLQTSL